VHKLSEQLLLWHKVIFQYYDTLGCIKAPSRAFHNCFAWKSIGVLVTRVNVEEIKKSKYPYNSCLGQCLQQRCVDKHMQGCLILSQL